MSRIIDVAHQGQLESVLEKLFPGEKILKNTREEANIKKSFSNSYLELDVWIPSLSLCFEFQDEYHYATTWYSHVPLESIQMKDKEKRELILRKSDTLVLVPYWWDSKASSLITTIRFHRPDLLLGHKTGAPPIPFNHPGSQLGYVPDVGLLMPASFPPTFNFTNSISVQDPWWMGEKYDGIRCCWHPTKQILYTRSALPISLPDNFSAVLGVNFLDGEIWFGRGFFLESQVLLNADWKDWSFLRLVGFDEPSATTQDLPFETRYAQLLVNAHPEHPLITVAARYLCTNKERVTIALQNVIEDGGEGVILRKPNSLYESGRSSSLIKLKASRGDIEGLVTAVNVDDTVTLQLPDGITFKVSVHKVQPKKGDVVTFSYENYSRNAIPVNPKIFRIRSDMTWEDVVYNFEQQPIATTKFVNEASKLGSKSKKPIRYWVSEKGANIRAFLMKYAKSKNLDPFKAESWYHLSLKQFLQTEGSSSMLQHFKGSFVKALVHLFPEVPFDRSRFVSLPQNYWFEVRNRRKFFDTYAKKRGFDPLVASNWYGVSYNSIIETKGGYSALAFYPGKSAAKALIHLYPEIGLLQTKFNFIPKAFWEKEKNRRTFFEEFAAKRNFDPLMASHWYSLSNTHLLVEPSANAVLSFHNDNIPIALVDLFPEVEFDLNKFPNPPKAQWVTAQHRKKFMQFAKQNEFDPLIADSWYSVTKKKILSMKGINNVLFCYKNNLIVALTHLFPEIDFARRKFVQIAKWEDVSNRRKFFDDFAESAKFDPLFHENWYYIQRDLFSTKSAIKSVLSFYNSSLAKALLHLYPEIGLQESRFNSLPRFHWTIPANRRIFFDNYAKDRKFDPLIATNWYKMSARDVKLLKRSGSVLAYTHGSLAKALMSLYPDIGLQEQKFFHQSQKDFLHNTAKRRRIFNEFAKERGFDPLVPTNWYSVPLESVLSYARTGAILNYTKGSLVKVLLSLYPDIGLDAKKFDNK